MPVVGFASDEVVDYINRGAKCGQLTNQVVQLKFDSR